jgi:uroporphyrinogen III methyltransferase/synthase
MRKKQMPAEQNRGDIGLAVAALRPEEAAPILADLAAFGLEIDRREPVGPGTEGLAGLQQGRYELLLLPLALGRAAVAAAGTDEFDWFVPRSALPEPGCLAPLSGAQPKPETAPGTAMQPASPKMGAAAVETPAEENPPALFFLKNRPRSARLRSFYVAAVAFVGGGPGDPGLCTVAGIEALRHCDLCLYDALVPASLLTELPAGARTLFVGKRCGRHSLDQREICRLLADSARRGLRVVRLKGGDPGIFGRLAEEIETFDGYGLPYRVVPGVSSLLAATTGTGMFLTRRYVSRGFTVMTPRRAAAASRKTGAEPRAEAELPPQPLVFFMALGKVGELVTDLLARGRSADEPAAVVWGASTPDERIVRGSLGDIAARVGEYHGELPGILMVGATTAYGLSYDWSALCEEPVLLLVQPDKLKACVEEVRAFGGRPVVPPPLLELSGIERRRPVFRVALVSDRRVKEQYRRQWGELPAEKTRSGEDGLRLIRELARERVAARLREEI